MNYSRNLAKNFGWRELSIFLMILLALSVLTSYTGYLHDRSASSNIKYVPRVPAILNDFYTEVRSKVLEGCGELCDHRILGKPGPFFNFVSKPVDCFALYNNTHSDAPATLWPPPEGIPEVMLNDFTMDNHIQVEYRYQMQRYSGAKAMENVWTREHIDELVAQAKASTLEGTYGVYETNTVIRTIREACENHLQCVKGLHVMVIGSERPWLEAILLAEGATSITTLEYGSITSTHPQVRTMLPSELRKKFLAGTFEMYDAFATFSSVEHSGLGRYGDTLNPWGDIQAIAKAWCVGKEYAPMFIGVMPGPDAQNVPGGRIGQDQLTWNLHRQYGKLRWAQMMTNWEQISRGYGGFQNIHVFRKMPFGT